MLTLTIDNQTVQVTEGTTILQAARQLGIHIPTLCFADGYKPTTSCMVCVVRVEGIKSLVPACGTRAADKMTVATDDAGVLQARRTAVELLLSEHVGDCAGPCQRGCPADMNIPRMIRQIAAGRFEDAIATVKQDIALPAVLGRICSAPCEKVCRRKQADGAVSICLLKRFAADVDLQSAAPYRPECLPDTGKTVAIVGAGPCGLSAAYYLQQAGIACTLFDDHDWPGGWLRYGDVDRDALPETVLDQEIAQILRLGVRFEAHVRIQREITLDALTGRYDAVLLAAGEPTDDFGVETTDTKIQVSRPDYATSRPMVFAAGGCMGSRNLTIRAVADGKEAAAAIQSRLLNQAGAVVRAYNHQMGRLDAKEMAQFLKQASAAERSEPQSRSAGLTAEQARTESQRCLHCDCRKADNCKLREAATELAARRNVWPVQRNLFEQITGCDKIVYEPGKCIKCGLCVQTAQKGGEAVGLSFQGRGFDTVIVAPFNVTLAEGLEKTAADCANICPTGALAFNEMTE